MSNKKDTYVIIILIAVVAALSLLLYCILGDNDDMVSEHKIENDTLEDTIEEDKENVSKEVEFGGEIVETECNVSIATTNWILAYALADIIGSNNSIAVVSSIDEVNGYEYVLGTGSAEDRWLEVNKEALNNTGVTVLNIVEYSSEEFDNYIASVINKQFNGESTLECGLEIEYYPCREEYSWCTYNGITKLYQDITDMIKKIDRANRGLYESNLAFVIDEIATTFDSLSDSTLSNVIYKGFEHNIELNTIAHIIKHNYN